MRYEIVLTPEAIEDINRLRAHQRSAVKDAIKQKLRFLPTKRSRSGIKRLRGLARPQYRLREGDIRVFYDVFEDEVVVLAILHKDEVDDWLAQFGVEENETDSLV
jgi:mRNA-degrading endonuclease RelE of RelBE toxin-antitoxin system